MEIVETNNESVVEPSYKKSTISYAKSSGYRSKMRGESTLSKTYSWTSKRSRKCKQRYIDNLRDQLKPTCLINGPENLPDDFKV